MKLKEPMDRFDERVGEALERKPEVHVPADFAARVAGRIAAMPVHQVARAKSYGHAATALAAALLLLAMFFLAPWTQPSFTSLGFDIQLVMLVQMLAIGCWFFARQKA